MSVLPILPQGFVVGRILTSRGDSADADKKADSAVVVGMVDFAPATAYRKLNATTVVTHSKITAKLDSHGDLHPQRETGDTTGSDTEDGIWLPTGMWRVTYRLNTGFGALPEHGIEVTTAHTEAAPLSLFANLGDPAPAGATLVQLTVPLGGQQGQVLVMNDGSLSWGDMSGGTGMTTEGVQDIVGAMVTGAGGTYDDAAGTITLPGGGGGYPVQQVNLTANYVLDPVALGWPTTEIVTLVITQDATGGRTVTYASSIDGTQAPVRTAANSQTIVDFYPLGGGQWRAFSDYVTSTPTTPPADNVPPVAGTMTASNVTSTGFRLTTAGWSDDGGLDPLPFSYSLDGGSAWTAWQESEIYNASGLTPATAHQCMHRVRDYAGNITVGSPLNVTTLVAITWAPTFTMGTPGLTSIVATASVLSAQASSYQVSYDGGATQSTIAPSGNAFTLSGSAGQAYTNTRLRAVRGTEVGSWVSVPSYTLQAGVTLTPTYRGSGVKKEATLTSTTWAAVPLGTPSATRTVIVYVERDSASFSTAEDLSTATLTVGGVAATADLAFNPHETGLEAMDRRTAVYRAVVPSGTTGDIVFTTPKVGVQTRMAAWTIDAPLALVAANRSGRISAGSGSVAVATSEGGFIVAAVVNNNGTTTWTGLPAPDWNVSEYSGGWVASNGQATTISASAVSGRLLLASYQGA